MFVDFFLGLGAHVRGIRFALARKGYLGLALIPFLLTVLLYGIGFSLFAANGDRMLALLWSPDPAPAARGPGGRPLLGLLPTWSNTCSTCWPSPSCISCSWSRPTSWPRPSTTPSPDDWPGRPAATGSANGGKGLSIWATMVEEVKKALFVAVVPILLVFIPVVGQLLAPVAAAMLLAFDFVDFSLGRDEERFAGRLRYMRRRPLLLLGFGLPLLVPGLNLLLYPFAILGSSLAYQETAGRHLLATPRK